MKYVLNILALIILFSFVGYSQPTKTNQGYQIGSKIEEFKMKHVDGEYHTLSSIDGANGYIIIFTSSVCPFAVAYEDRIIELHNSMKTKGYPVVAINSNDGSNESGDSFEAMVTRHKEKNFPFLYLKDEVEEYAKFGANKTPHVFLLDKDMVVRYKGSIDDSPNEPSEVDVKYVEDAIAALENGSTPDPQITKAIGCPIKVKGAKGAKGKKGNRKGPPAPGQIMKRMDKDNKIAKDEAHGPLGKDFDRLDKNKDGFLTMEELSIMRKRK